MFKRKLRKLLSRFGIGPGKKLTLLEAQSRGLNLLKLHLGCGNIYVPEWCNVDAIPTGCTDLVCDIQTLPDIPDSTAQQIYSCHVLEHFATEHIPEILIRWFEILKPGGELRISVPDLDAITAIYQKNLAHFQVPGHQPWIALIYGGQKDQYDFHLTGFNFCWLKYLLENAGFTNVQRYEFTPHFVPGLVDNSLAQEPFGEYISLNIMATKPLK